MNYEGWVRKPELDQPRLVSSQVGYENQAIPAQVGFTTPEGADVQMSYERARDLGLIATAVIATARIDKYGGAK